MPSSYKSEIVQFDLIDITGLSEVEISKDITKRVSLIKKRISNMPVEGSLELKYTGTTINKFNNALIKSPVMNGRSNVKISRKVKILVSLY